MTTPHFLKRQPSIDTLAKTDCFSDEDRCIWQLKQFWFCQSLLSCNGIKRIEKEIFHQDSALNYLGFKENEFEDTKPSTINKAIKKRALKLTSVHSKRHGTLFSNLEKIHLHFGLNQVEIELLLFATLLELDPDYSECYDIFGKLSNRILYSILSRVLNIPDKSVKDALNKNSSLHQSGLLKVDSSTVHLDRKFDLLSGFCSALEISQKNIESLFSGFIALSPAGTLTPTHYQHIESDYSDLSDYLQTVCKQNTLGANVLIYGPPGTGKTEWVRTITHDLSIKLYEISVEDSDGDILTGKERVTACQLAQNLLEKGKQQCILFDEIEDLFQTDSLGQALNSHHRGSQSNKGWINQLLENNNVPTFWISNDINCMDDAFLRRFDLIFELPVPPASVRKQMLTDALVDTDVSIQWIDRMSNITHLPPAIINRANRVNKIIGKSDTQLIENNLEKLIGNTLKAMGHKHHPIQIAPSGFYDPTLINTTACLDKISQGLNSSGEGRLCFYGAPGTGKSAYATYLADHLEIPLIAKRASDIVDCYVGNTEKNIASMFEEATKEEGLLLLDEADSFLRDRAHSRNSWETTQVNELLVQMENYKGIFICSTNLMKDLDPAALRRFDFKLEFTYLKIEQAWLLLKGFIGKPLNSLSPRKKGDLKKRLSRIEFLTPGDFASVKRQLTVMGEMDNVELFIQELKNEVGFKSEQNTSKRSIGFAAEF